MTQQYTNLASSTLASSYTAGGTTVTLASGDGAKFPTTGDFTIAVGQPPAFFLQCTSRTGDTLTVDTIATEGTTAANASSATVVTQVITAGVLDGIRSDQNQVGPYSSLPSSGMRKGDSYKCIDSPYEYVYNGSAWQAFVFGYAVTEPILSSFTQVNVGLSTFDSTHGGILQSVTNAGSTGNVQILATDIPTSGAYYADAACTLLSSASNGGSGVGLSAGTSTSSGIAFNEFGYESGSAWYYERGLYNSTTSWNSNGGGMNLVAIGPLFWTRVYDDRTTNRTFYISLNGYVWHQVYQESRTTLFEPAQVVLAVGPYNCTIDLHWLHFSIHT
jgi:hypothetical protein